MGMDVYGKNSTTESGEYFRANVWSWRPILDLIYLADETFDLNIDNETLIHMGYNDGAGLTTQHDCNTLATAIESLLDDEGDVISWDCGDPDFEDAYRVGKPHVEQFIEFLRNCGGFEVW